jgi:hypothetical protein
MSSSFWRIFTKQIDYKPIKIHISTEGGELYIFGVILCSSALYLYGTQKQKTITVVKKYTFCRNGFTEFMIIDTNNKHYNINNSWWYWKWNSLEDWCQIEPNDTVQIKYYGWRIPFLGLFPNVFYSNRLLPSKNVEPEPAPITNRIFESQYKRVDDDFYSILYS